MKLYVRRSMSALAAMSMLIGLTLITSTPAHAVGQVDLEGTQSQITLGESFDLTWVTSDTTSLVASGNWSGDKAIPNGSETITPTEPGYHEYTLTATDDEGETSEDMVDVYVVSPDKLTPESVTFDGCDVLIPESPNVTYIAGLEGSNDLEAGTYPAGYFYVPGLLSYFFARADDGYEFADDATMMWTQDIPAECLEGSTLVTSSATCQSITFTSVSDVAVSVYGPFEEAEPDGILELAAGATRTVETDRKVFPYFAKSTDFSFQIDQAVAPTGCGDGSPDHPTVAPAAGR